MLTAKHGQLLWRNLPARLDWSIIGWTMRLRALMNLERGKRKKINKGFRGLTRRSSAIGLIYQGLHYSPSCVDKP